MTIRTRTLVFSTFFGCCVSIGLLLLSLTTNNWVGAHPRRENTPDAKGEVNYGLFYGSKILNTGFGNRTHHVKVFNYIHETHGTMSFWLWLITALGTGFGLLGCAIAAIAAVVKAASAAKKPLSMVLLFASNISSAIAQIIAFICWLIQFIEYLSHNVLTMEDHNQKWHSHNLAYLGYSFYLVLASLLVVLMNIIILIYARRYDRRYQRRLEPPSEEKNQSAIMLY